MSNLERYNYIGLWPHQDLWRISDIFNELNKYVGQDFPKYEQKIIKGENDQHTLSIQFMLAGYPKENLSVEATDSVLTVSSEKVEDNELECFARRAFKKQFNDTSGYWDFKKADVSYKDGILKIKIPMKSETIGKKLLIA